MCRSRKQRSHASNIKENSTAASSFRDSATVTCVGPELVTLPHSSRPATTGAHVSTSRPSSSTSTEALPRSQSTTGDTESQSSSSARRSAPTNASLKKTDDALLYAMTAIDVAQDVISVLTFIPTPVGAALGAALCILEIVQVGGTACDTNFDARLIHEENGRQQETRAEASQEDS